MIPGFRTAAVLLCLVAGAAPAQTADLSVSGGSIWSGSPAIFVVSLHSTSGAVPAALQWNLAYSPSVITGIRIDDGAAVVAADKTVICAPNPRGQTCLALGNNAATIADGAVAVVVATLAPGATSATIVVTNTLAASAAGNEILLLGANGGTATVTVSAPAVLKPLPK
jgi:hypothetical protein